MVDSVDVHTQTKLESPLISFQTLVSIDVMVLLAIQVYASLP